MNSSFYLSNMKNWLLIAAMFTVTSCGADTPEKVTETKETVVAEERDTLADAVITQALEAASSPAPEPAGPVADTFCYVAVQGKNTNAIKLIIAGDKVTGELRYLVEGEQPADGDLIGTLKDNVISADWTYVKGVDYYKVPVQFKMTDKSVVQKPTAVDEKGVPYIPEDAEFVYEFPQVDCSKYPKRTQAKINFSRVH